MTPRTTLRPRSARRTRATIAIVALIACGLVFAGAGAIWAFTATAGRTTMLDDASIDWPEQGVAGLSIGGAVAVSDGGDTPRPMASLTKLVTAVVVLDTAPLAPGDQGPSFPMSDADADLASAEAARGGAFTAVSAGQVFTQRQLLEQMLVASSNNLATSLVSRVFGSEDAYLGAARRWLDEHGLPDVRIADASGMSPGNVASVRDLLAIGRMAAADPVIAEIAALPATHAAASAPQPNTNDLLGTLGISGLKTGHTDAAGYTALFTTTIGDDDALLVGVVLGSPSSAQRMTDVTRLIARVQSLAAG